MSHHLSAVALRVKYFLSDAREVFATRGASLFRRPKSLQDIPYKLVFEIAQTLSQLADTESTARRQPLIDQLATETALIKEHAQDIFILLNCPAELRVDFKHAAERIRPRYLGSQLDAMEALFLALAWDDPSKGRPVIKRTDEYLAVSTSVPRPIRRGFNFRVLLKAGVSIPLGALLAYLAGIDELGQAWHVPGGYVETWGVCVAALWVGVVIGDIENLLRRPTRGHEHEQAVER